MKHPACPPEYHVEHVAPIGGHLSYAEDGSRIKYLRVKRENITVANIDEKGHLWEMTDAFSVRRIDFPSLDEALRYAETKMALGILGERE